MNAETPDKKIEKDDNQQAIASSSVSDVAPEPDLPPTPTPAPTPDPAIAAQQLLVQETHAKQIAVCLEVLEREGYAPGSRANMHAFTQVTVSNAKHDNIDQSSDDQSPSIQSLSSDDCGDTLSAVQVQASAKSTAPVFDPSNVKQNLQTLVIYCINKSTKDLSSSIGGSNDDTHLTLQLTTKYSQSLVKYANAMTCADSEDFPGCMPSEAEKLVKQGPMDGEWPCF